MLNLFILLPPRFVHIVTWSKIVKGYHLEWWSLAKANNWMTFNRLL